ncbi:MAG: F0F1 ATP synthase subunit A [Firmicutes bacterium]|nr:F0F1 ATP synthase subunit A [Bacillota bacterium]MDD4262948.1 F0F1 ATP synthase subunit A [Bacillota bacterium]MDD4693179.1 F0F1 ATP synthase subunit A [Bacillota bacterium]
MEVNIGGKVVFTLFDTIYITDMVIVTWGIMAVLVVLGYFAGRLFKDRPIDQPPKGAANVVEAIYEVVANYIVDTMGKHNTHYIPYMGTLFIFLLVANFSGLLGLRPPTSDLNTVAALAILSFLLIQGTALRGGLWNYIKGFFDPIPAMFPLNVISEFATPFSLTMRLFGNILSGYLIVGLVYVALTSVPYLFFIAQPIHMYFDLFSGFIQMLIFGTLTMAMITGKE